MASIIKTAGELLEFCEAADQDDQDTAYVITYREGIQPQTYKDLNAKAEPVSSSQNEAKKAKKTKVLDVQKVIGRGKFSVVLKATMFDRQAGWDICLKQSLQDNFKYLKHENRILSLLKKYPHSNIIKREFLCKPDNSPCWFLGLELFEGETLMDIIDKMTNQECDRFPDIHLIGLLEQQAGAVDHLLRCDIYHYDIHPGNIMYNRNTGHSKLIDFGCAIENGKHPVVSGGTTEYMAPEVMLQLYLRRGSDVYGLAATILHLITLRRPWHSLHNQHEAMLKDITCQLTDYYNLKRAPVLAVQNEVRHGTCHEYFKQILVPMLNLLARDRSTCDEIIHRLSELRLHIGYSGRSNDGDNIATLQLPFADSSSANVYESENMAGISSSQQMPHTPSQRFKGSIPQSGKILSKRTRDTPYSRHTTETPQGQGLVLPKKPATALHNLALEDVKLIEPLVEGAQTSACKQLHHPEDSDDSDDL